MKKRNIYLEKHEKKHDVDLSTDDHVHEKK